MYRENFHSITIDKKTNMGFVVIYHGKMLSLRIVIRLLLQTLIPFHTLYVLVALFSIPVALHLFHFPNLLCELCTKKLLHFIFLFFFLCFYFFNFFPFLKVCICNAKLYHHLMFLLVIWLHHGQLCLIKYHKKFLTLVLKHSIKLNNFC